MITFVYICFVVYNSMTPISPHLLELEVFRKKSPAFSFHCEETMLKRLWNLLIIGTAFSWAQMRSWPQDSLHSSPPREQAWCGVGTGSIHFSVSIYIKHLLCQTLCYSLSYKLCRGIVLLSFGLLPALAHSCCSINVDFLLCLGNHVMKCKEVGLESIWVWISFLPLVSILAFTSLSLCFYIYSKMEITNSDYNKF